MNNTKQQTERIKSLIIEYIYGGRVIASPKHILDCIEMAYSEGVRDGKALNGDAGKVKQLEDYWDI